MPTLTKKRGKLRWKGSIMVRGEKKERLFPDNSTDSKRKAVHWEKEQKDIMMSQPETPMESAIFDQWVEDYLNDAKSRFSYETYKEKRSVFEKFAKEDDVYPNMPVDDLSIAMCRKYLQKQFKSRSGHATNKDRKNLSAAWNYGRDYLAGWPQCQNPFQAIKKFPEKKSPRYVPPEKDFWKVFAISEGQDQVMLFAFLHLAARRKEIFGLKWDDVDFSNSTIRLWTNKREGSNLEFDILPMTSELRKALLGWREIRLSQSGVDQEYVFICLDKTAFCEQYYGKPFRNRQQVMKRLCEKADVEHFGFHAIRHLTASILYQQGYAIATIQAILRHKNPNTTARYLKTLSLEDTRKALEEGLKGRCEIIPFKKQEASG